MPLKILVSGARGLIGSALTTALREQGHYVTPLLRSFPKRTILTWNDLESHPEKLEGFDAVVHLAGAAIGHARLSLRRRNRYWNSRIVTTDRLVKAFNKRERQPKVFISASCVKIYGDQNDRILEESSPIGKGFIPTLFRTAEEYASKANMRNAQLRFGTILSDAGGDLAELAPLFKTGAGGRYGSGKQWRSWVHIDDAVRAILHVLHNDQLEGPINVASPHPVQDLDHALAMSVVMNRPMLLPVHAWYLYLTCGKTLTRELLLSSQRVNPTKLLKSGFSFHHPTYVASLVELLQPEYLGDLEVAERTVAEKQLERHRKEQK